MPEGPSLLVLRVQAQVFQGKRVVAVEGHSKIDQQRMVGQGIVGLRTWDNALAPRARRKAAKRPVSRAAAR